MRLRISLLFALAVVAACKSKEEATSGSQSAAEKARIVDVPRDRIYAASSHLRVVDIAAGQAIAGLQIQRAVTSIAFTADGRRAFLGCSDGVREIDTETTKVTFKLSESPVRQLLRSPDGSRLWVLEHDVNMVEGKPVPTVYRLKTIDLATRKVLAVEEIGDRILGVVPSLGPDRVSVIADETMQLRIGKPGRPLKEAVVADLAAGVPSKTLVVRPYLSISDDGAKAYFPVEGMPSRIVEIDLASGKLRALSLGEKMILRGVTPSSDGKKLYVNASRSLIVLDTASGKPIGEPLALDAPQMGIVLGQDGRRAYLAQVVHEGGGAITIIELDPLRVQGKIHLADISPWTIAVQPQPSFAAR